MLLSADRRSSRRTRPPPPSPRRRRRAVAVGPSAANFACNSCLIADRTIAIRRRGAAVMRTKSELARAPDTRLRPAPLRSAVVLPALSAGVRRARGESSCPRSGPVRPEFVDFPAVPSTTRTIVRDGSDCEGRLVVSAWPGV